MRCFAGCDALLKQAGADPNINDPLGGWLTTEQLRERDQLVFEYCRQVKLPIAWNLAGDYQNPLRRVLDIQDNAMLKCLQHSRSEAKSEAMVSSSGRTDSLRMG